MPRLAISLSLFFLMIFLFQQSSYGFIEGDEVPSFFDLDTSTSPDSILMDLPRQELSLIHI